MVRYTGKYETHSRILEERIGGKRMTITEQENAHLINHFETLKREIALEREAQLASIARVIGHDAELIIAKLRLLSEYEKEADRIGKAAEQPTAS
jgi:hypothetical protein